MTPPTPATPSREGELITMPGGSATPSWRLLCFHHAGGSRQVFRGWAKALPDVAMLTQGERPRFPGRPWSQMIDAVVAELAAAPPLPLVVFGHSLGALIALETARRLEHAGTPAERLVVTGRAAPRRAAPGSWPADDEALLASLARHGGVPEEILGEPTLMRFAVRRLRTDLALLDAYTDSGETVSCPIVAARGAADDTVDDEGLAEWAEVTSGPLRRHVVPGGHLPLEAQRDDLIPLCARSTP